MRRTTLVATLGTALWLAGCGGGDSGDPFPTASELPKATSSHVITIVMENKEYRQVIGNPAAPYINRLARRYGLATNSYGVGHQSLPDYLALTGGSTHGITSDCTSCHVAARNIVDQLETAHVSWKAYMEDMPQPCFMGVEANRYVKRHDPFVYYDDIIRDPARCRRVVPYARLAEDLRRGTLPTYAFISPNLCNDMHDCDVATGDRFLALLVPSLLRALGPQGYLVLTWDEGTTNRGCCGGARGGHIPTVVAGPLVRRSARNGRPLDDYGVLHTIEDTLGLPRLADAAEHGHGRLDALFTRIPRLTAGR